LKNGRATYPEWLGFHKIKDHPKNFKLMITAGIDIGTNTVRLIVIECKDGKIQKLSTRTEQLQGWEKVLSIQAY